jgi:hypothetical protein
MLVKMHFELPLYGPAEIHRNLRSPFISLHAFVKSFSQISDSLSK